MAQVFQSSSPFILGKRSCDVFSPSHHSHHDSQMDAEESERGSSQYKKRRLFGSVEQDPPAEAPSSSGGNEQRKRMRSEAFTGTGSGHNHSYGSQMQEQNSLAPEDRPIYSARQMESELNKLKNEVATHLAAKKAEGEAATGVLTRELEQMQHENKILKRAVTIQDGRYKEIESQLSSLQQIASQGAEYVKRLEQINYALGVRVQQMGQSNNDFLGGLRPPDVF